MKRRFAANVTGILLLLASAAGLSQTADQLKALQSMPPAQRAELLRQLGEGGNAEIVEGAPAQLPSLVMDRELGEPAVPEKDQEPRFEPGSTIVVTLSHDEELSEREVQLMEGALAPRIVDLLGSTVFELDQNGVLVIDDYYEIPLGGLTEKQAAIRIAAERDFQPFEVGVTLLPLTESGADALQRFGYDLFAGQPTTFAPATDIPVPANYIIGPGDTVKLQLFGSENARYSLVVARDGTLQIPGIGPVVVAGMRFETMRAELDSLVAEQKIGVEASVTLGELRSIRVFVLGDAFAPGSYTVSGLSTMTHALYLSGGINEHGSLRKVQLKRNGRTIRTLDLYDLLLDGDTRNDLLLRQGDAVFVQPVGPTVAVSGEVVRPAIYELNGEKTVAEVVELAGGLLPTAHTASVIIDRIDNGRRCTLEVNLATRAGENQSVRDGDFIKIGAVIDEMQQSVSLQGHVHRPGAKQFSRGLRLSDVIPSSSAVRQQADLNYVLIVRESGAERFTSLLSANLEAAWAGDPRHNVLLEPRDQIVVFSLDASRADRIAPYLEQLRLQSRSGEPAAEVRVGGRIAASGDYPLEPGMRISDLLRAGGGLQESAYTLNAELARYDVVDGEARQTDLLTVDLAGVLEGNLQSDLELRPHDHLIIKEIPLWQLQESVELLGEVRFPGTYLLQRGETLSSVIARAGGLTDLAFPDGSVFFREELKRREQEQIENLAARLEADIVSFSLQALQTDANAGQALSIGQSLLQQLRETTATGRLVIDVEEVLQRPSDPVYDVVMRDGDTLFIPRQTQEVTVLGEVQYATSHIFEPGLSRNDYIARSGGLTQKADRRRIYIVRASGVVVSGEGARWFSRPDVADIRPGDTIVVPLDADRMGALAKWTNVSQIIYQLALAAASANAVGVF